MLCILPEEALADLLEAHAEEDKSFSKFKDDLEACVQVCFNKTFLWKCVDHFKC